jgi:hypothetical protein
MTFSAVEVDSQIAPGKSLKDCGSAKTSGRQVTKDLEQRFFPFLSRNLFLIVQIITIGIQMGLQQGYGQFQVIPLCQNRLYSPLVDAHSG